MDAVEQVPRDAASHEALPANGLAVAEPAPQCPQSTAEVAKLPGRGGVPLLIGEPLASLTGIPLDTSGVPVPDFASSWSMFFEGEALAHLPLSHQGTPGIVLQPLQHRFAAPLDRSDEDFAVLQADPVALQAYYAAMVDAGVPYSGWPLDVAGFGIADGDSPATSPGVTPGPTTPTVAKEKKSNGRGQRASSTKFKGVSCYKRTGRFESHIWSNGRQVHLGSFRIPEEAARAYDMAAICFRGWEVDTNFPRELYRDDTVLAWHMSNDSTDAFIAWLRRGGREPGSMGAVCRRSVDTAAAPAEEEQPATGVQPADNGICDTDRMGTVSHAVTAGGADTEFLSLLHE